MAPDDDDDFWTTYIAATPEEDKHFRSVGRLILWPIIAIVIAILIATLFK
jgi:hypothetical protein